MTSENSTLTALAYAEVEKRLLAHGVPADRLDEQMGRWESFAATTGRKLTAGFVDYHFGICGPVPPNRPSPVAIRPSTLHRCHVLTARRRTISLVRMDEPEMLLIAAGVGE